MPITVVPRYAYRIGTSEDGERTLSFPRFPEIISHLPIEEFDAMSDNQRLDFAHDAVITALSARVLNYQTIPAGDDDRVLCDGYVELEVEEAMKVALFEVFRGQFKSVSALARKINKPETTARRLLDFRHKSRPSEIQGAITLLGKKLHHVWHLSAT